MLMRAMNLGADRMFNPDRKDAYWGKLKRDEAIAQTGQPRS
jgi:hypothetical protein